MLHAAPLPVGPPPAREASPPPRVLVAGTSAAVCQLVPALRWVEPRPAVVGAVLARPGQVPCEVLGGLPDLSQLAHEHRVQRVILTLPAAMRGLTRALADALDAQGIAWSYVAPLNDQLAGRAFQPRAADELDPAVLIDRRPSTPDPKLLTALLTGKTVLITGAGGSIGSELARVAARHAPAGLVLLERAENALFEIDRRLRGHYPGLAIEAVLHDVTLRERTFDIIDRVKPQVVIHAAAHKHVPMMEDHPAEAVENNFYGTRSIADAADRCGVERFVMISTDKAVNPSSVMGASKRLAELYIRNLNRQSPTTYCMVRFGNVLGSACSVLPIWADQLRAGGPITVTHERMTRYFMTIPEAASLVLQAAALSGTFRQPDAQGGEAPGLSPGIGGEVFLLDMGRPIRILEMAERFVRAQGLEPGRDVEVRITGARPGEKLFEELAYDSEDMLPTAHPSIRVWRTAPPDDAQIHQVLATFDRLRGRSGDMTQPWRGVPVEAVVTAIRAQLPEMVAAAAG